MPALRSHLDDSDFRHGVRDMLAYAPGIAAWGLVTGMAMVQAGLSVPLALLMTLAVYAGSAQLASLPLLAAGAPMWVVCAAAFCVNLRFVIYSAQLRVYCEHLAPLRRVVLASFSADMNLIAFLRAGTGPLFRRRCDHDLADLADLLDRRHSVVRPDSLALGPGFC